MGQLPSGSTFTNTASPPPPPPRLPPHTTRNNGASVRRVTEKMWLSDGGHSSANQQQSLRNHQRASFTFHTPHWSGDGSHPSLSAPSPSDRPFICHSPITAKRTFVTPDLRDSGTHFPRLWDVKGTRPFHGGRMTALQIILS